METIVRFDMRGPGFGAPMPVLYATALEMVEFADARGVDVIMLTEHHGVEDGYCPAPTVLAGGVAARSTQARIRLASVVLPLHNPVQVAEQTLVLDQMSNGRVELVTGAGYVQSEFAMFGLSLTQRPRLMDEGLRLLAAALAGDPIEIEGHEFTVTPPPVQCPRPPLIVAGGVAASARRAARWADGFYPLTADEQLRQLYRDACRSQGRPVGPIIDTTGPMFVHVAEDPQRAWAQIGPHALHELNSYGKWAAQSHVGELNSPFRPVEDIAAARATGLYAVVTPEECLALLNDLDATGKSLVLTPLLSGLPPELAWSSLELFFDQVLPAFRAHGSPVNPGPQRFVTTLNTAHAGKQLRALVDREQITAVLNAYCRLVDTCDVQRILGLFTQDAHIDYGPGLGGPIQGVEAMRAFFSGLTGFRASSHHLSNIEIEFDGPDAARCYSYLYASNEISPALPPAVNHGRYQDRLVRTSAGWRITERILRSASSSGFEPIGYDAEAAQWWNPVDRVVSAPEPAATSQ